MAHARSAYNEWHDTTKATDKPYAHLHKHPRRKQMVAWRHTLRFHRSLESG